MSSLVGFDVSELGMGLSQAWLSGFAYGWRAALPAATGLEDNLLERGALPLECVAEEAIIEVVSLRIFA